jgi:4-hydroxybenzoyl-CoA reductase subunit beta
MVAEKTYLRPASVEEAVSLAKANENNFSFLAGGTDALVNKYQGNKESACLIDISGLKELKTVEAFANEIHIGALVTLHELQQHPLLREHFPSLLMAAGEVASPVIRKTATIGGNVLCENRCSFYNQSEWWREAVGYCLKCEGDVCIATGGTKACFSKFVSDTAPVIIALNGRVELQDFEGKKTIPLENIYTGDGIAPRNISPTTLLTKIILPTDKTYQVVFKKLRPREAVDFTSLTTAMARSSDGKIRIVVGGVDPQPVLVEGDASQHEELMKKAFSKARVVDNDIYSRKYRREMLQLFLEKSWEEMEEIL